MGQSNKSGQRNPNNPPNPRNGRTMVEFNPALKYTEEDLQRVIRTAQVNAKQHLLEELGITTLNSEHTISSRMYFEGHDDFADLINKERGSLCLGKLTDDELANAVFMQGDISKEEDMRMLLASQAVGRDYYSKIAVVTAGKERIRWLSRHLEQTLERVQYLEKELYGQGT